MQKVVLLVLCLAFVGCRSTYYSVWEKFGKHKRDLLRDNVEQVRDDQQAAAEQFKDALTRLKELTGFKGGDLEKIYDRLNSDYKASEAKASTVRDHIRKVEQVAGDLFKEWEQEIGQIQSPNLRSSSRSKLTETKGKYESLHQAMLRAERSMQPVLTQFRDHVLYLKHNLNAQAVGALKGEVGTIESDVSALLQEMNRAIAEADAFIKTLP
jgi:outer membrane murein-binding lipoprotein Lpp